MWIDDSVSRSANLAKRGPATSMWWSSDAESAWKWMTVICLPSSLKKALHAMSWRSFSSTKSASVPMASLSCSSAPSRTSDVSTYTSGCTSTSRVWGMAVRAHDCQPQDARRGQRVLERLEARDLAVLELPDLGHALAGLAAVQANRHAPEHHDHVAAVDPLLRHELERLVGAWDLRKHVSADGLGTTMDAAVGQALDVCLDPLDVGRERSQHRLDLAAPERAVQLLDLLEIGHVGNTKPSLPRSATRNSAGHAPTLLLLPWGSDTLDLWKSAWRALLRIMRKQKGGCAWREADPERATTA